MSDQKKGAGHHAITREATHKLFSKSGKNGKIMGLDEHAFFKKLDKWQAFADRSPVGGILEPTPGGVGDTWHQAQDNPGAQRKHSMADPSKSGKENLQDIQKFITDQLLQARYFHSQGNYEKEWQCLGAAVHALEDSYSNAHVFRDPNNPTDPYAKIEAFNVFYWFNTTHNKIFDSVPVTDGHLERATDQASRDAVAKILSIYFDHLDDSDNITNDLLSKEILNLLHGDDIHVFNDIHSSEYQAQTEAHYHNEISFDGTLGNNHSAEKTEPAHPQQNESTDPVMSLFDGTTVYSGTDSTQSDSSQQILSTDSSISLPDGATVYHGSDSNQIDLSQQLHSIDSNISLPDGATVHHGADSNQIDLSQHLHSTDSNINLPDGATVYHGSDSNQTDHSQQSHTTDSNISLPDGATVYHGSDSNQTDHSQQSHTTDSNISLPDGATVYHGSDSNQTDHSQQSHTTDSNISLPDGATVYHGSDSNQTDHSQQSQATEHNSNSSHDDGSQSFHP